MSSTPTEAPSGPWGRVAGWLGRPRAWCFIVLLGVLAVAPCLTVGFSTDDHLLRIRFDPDSSVPPFSSSPFDLFSFGQGEAQIRGFMELGMFSWWTAPGYKLAFWRPVSSATHALDFTLWPQSPMLMYAHSLLWYAALLTVLAALYRRLMPGWTAGLALLVYALDDAHGPTVGYISNRNALVMTTLALAALWAHDRARRDGWRPGRWLSPSLMALGLLAGEGAVVGFGYLFAHACFMESGGLLRRWRPLLPHVLVGGTWAVAYKLQGFGAHGSGIYLEPAGETGAYLQAALERVPVLLGAQLAGPWADFWLAYPPAVATGVLVFVLLVIAGVTALAWPVLRREPVARTWALGSVLACLPIAGTFPADRLLVFVGVGAAGLVAMVLVDVATRRPRASLARRAGAAGLVVIHCVLGPLLLPIRARSMETVARSFEHIDRAVPGDRSIVDRTLVVVRTPSDGLVLYLPAIRAARHEPSPGRLRVLSSTGLAARITRVGPESLRIEPEGGFLASTPERMLRGPGHPFAVGDVVELSDLRVTVESITADARPAVVRFDFSRSLDDPSFVFITWYAAGFGDFTPPPVGETVTLPPVDAMETLRRTLQDDPS